MHYCSNFFEAKLLLTAVTFLGITVTVVNFFVNAEGYGNNINNNQNYLTTLPHLSQ